MDLNIKEMEGHNKSKHGQDEGNAMHWGYICSNPVQMSGSKRVSCSVRGGGCDSSWHRGPSSDGGHSSALWLMASRGAEIATGRKEKWEKEKVRTISQEIGEKRFILTMNKSGPNHSVSSISSKNATPCNLMTLDVKWQKSPLIPHNKLCIPCHQPDSAMLAVHTCHYHLQSVVWRAEAPSSQEFPAEAISTLWQHQGSLLVPFPTLLQSCPPCDKAQSLPHVLWAPSLASAFSCLVATLAQECTHGWQTGEAESHLQLITTKGGLYTTA